MTTYAEHIRAADRRAATALTLPTPATVGQAAALRALQDDLAGVLAAMTREITGLEPFHPGDFERADLARHPVHLLLTRLAALAAPADGDDTAPAAMPGRDAGHPATPEDLTSAVGVWRGVVAETDRARHALTTLAALCSDEERWAVMADVATLALVLASTRADLLTAPGLGPGRVRRERAHVVALASEAREVARLAGTRTRPPGSDTAIAWVQGSLVPVTVLVNLPPAVGNLQMLLRERPGNITDLLALIALLARTSRAAARALRVAGTHPARHAGPLDAGRLHAVAGALEEHAGALTRALAEDRARVGALVEGSGLLRAQATEIGANALPRLAALARSGEAARAAEAHLLGYAALTPGLTQTLREAVRRARRTRGAAVRDPAGRWRPAGHGDLEPLMANLNRAADLAGVATRHIPRRRAAAAGRAPPGWAGSGRRAGRPSGPAPRRPAPGRTLPPPP